MQKDLPATGGRHTRDKGSGALSVEQEPTKPTEVRKSPQAEPAAKAVETRKSAKTEGAAK